VVEPKAGTVTLAKTLESSLRLPGYQRDFVWDYDKCFQLWSDLKSHLFMHSQTLSSVNGLYKYFLGAIVVDDNGEENYLVDGQQRFTTMTLIAAAVRDALITTGHTSVALQLHDKIIQDKHRLNDPLRRNRFELLDIPKGGNPLSSEFQLSGYRKRLVNIPTGLITAASQRGSTSVEIDTDKSSNTKWSLQPKSEWEFRLWDSESKEFIGRLFTAKPIKKNKLRVGDNPPNEIEVNNVLRKEIEPGLEIILMSNSKWPDKSKLPLRHSSNTKERIPINDHFLCDLFAKPRRDLYFQVRSEAEHMILSEKKYYPSSGYSEDDLSSGLVYVSNDFSGQLPVSGRIPQLGESIEFIQDIPEKEDWESDETLLQLVYAGESKEVEFKQSFRVSNINGKLRKHGLMKQECMKAICGMLNTKGGHLFIGVTDSGSLSGIRNENFQTEDEAIVAVTQSAESHLGKLAIQYLDIKVVTLRDVPILCVKINKSGQPIECKYRKFNSTTSAWSDDPATNKFFVRQPNRTVPLVGNEKRNHLKQFFSSKVGSEQVKHTLKVYEFKNELWEIRVRGKVTSGQDIPPSSLCHLQYLEPGKTWPPHLDTPAKRATQLLKLITNVCFARITFQKDPAAAIDHFMLTNDATRMEHLTPFDLVSAYTQKIIRPAGVGRQKNRHQSSIEEHWNSVAEKLYISSGKNPRLINDFFSNWLLSTYRLDGTKRYTAKKCWSGIKKEYDKRTDDNGEFDYESMEDLYKEMADYARVYIRATDTDSELWHKAPYNQAEYRDERNYLLILKSTKMKQHIAPYMALVMKLENEYMEDRHIAAKFLKNLNHLWLRYRTIPNLMPSTGTGFQPNELYGQMLGENGWIKRIRETSSKQGFDRGIADLPFALEPDDKSAWPWETGSDSWPLLNVDGTEQGAYVKHILLSAERALETGSNPSMSRIHGIAKFQTEHVLPRDPKYLSGKWNDDGNSTALHTRLRYTIGNHCLIEDSINSSVRNKPPPDKASHPKGYGQSNFKTTQFASSLLSSSSKWDEGEMKTNALNIMNSIIRFFSG